MAYQHTQIGTIIFVLVAIIIGIMIVVWLNSDNGYWIIPAATIVFLVVLLTLFGTLTVEINGNTLQCRFGIGLIRKSFSLSDITAVTTVSNPWYYGWGIRLTPKGWMFNVSGLDAVELTFTSGKQFRIGTDQPRRLAAAIQEKIDPPQRINKRKGRIRISDTHNRLLFPLSQPWERGLGGEGNPDSASEDFAPNIP